MISVGIDIGIRNLGICILKQVGNDKEMILLDNIDLFPNKKISKDQTVLCKKLKNCLDNYCILLKDVKEKTYISIEQQPPKNRIMTKFSYFIFSYFIFNNFKHVKFINAKRKLDLFKDKVTYNRKFNTYKDRKLTALMDTKYYMEILNIKKDKITFDEADAFLYAFYYRDNFKLN